MAAPRPHSGVHGMHHGARPNIDVQKTLKRGLKAPQITMLVIAGTIGTGLIIGSGQGLFEGGPLGLVLGYLFMGFLGYSIVSSLGEMAAFLPHRRGLGGYVSRFWNPAVGFAVGWAYVINHWMVCPIQINMVVASFQNYKTEGFAKSKEGGMIFLVIGVCTALNVLPIRWYGVLEFWLSSCKIVFLVALTLFGIAYDTGRIQSERPECLGGCLWRSPNGPLGSLEQVHNRHFKTLLIICSFLTNALFAYDGIEIIGVVAGEAVNPRKQIRKAVNQTFWTIFSLYTAAVVVISFMLPSTSLDNSASNNQFKSSILGSPFWIAAKNTKEKALPAVFNSFVMVFAVSATTTNLYVSSRTLYALAIEEHIPFRWLRTYLKMVTRWGVPWGSLSVTCAISFLAYLGLDMSALAVRKVFVALSTTFTGLIWICLSYTYIRFRKGRERNERFDNEHFKAPAWLQPWSAYLMIIVTSILLLFKGAGTWSESTWEWKPFLYSYMGIVVYFISYLIGVWKYGWRSSVSVEKIDWDEGVRLFEDGYEEDEEDVLPLSP